MNYSYQMKRDTIVCKIEIPRNTDKIKHGVIKYSLYNKKQRHKISIVQIVKIWGN